MPHKSSNIPSKIFYSTASAKTVRISKAKTCYNSFVKLSKSLMKRIENQGGSDINLKYSLNKMLNKYTEI